MVTKNKMLNEETIQTAGIQMEKIDTKKQSTKPKLQVTIEQHNMATNINNKSEKDKNTAEILQQPNNLEDVLKSLKITGRYHIKMFLLIGLLNIICTEHSINYIFSAEDVNYSCRYQNCKVTDLAKLVQNSTLDLKCYQYNMLDYNATCTLDNFDTVNATDCTEWVYDKPNSFVAEFDLGCEDWKRTLVGTMHSIGFMLGLLFIGPLSDRIGRKKLIIFNLVAAGLIGVIKSFVTSYWVYIALEMVEPMFGEYYSTLFTMGMEMVTKDHRPAMIGVLSVGNCIGLLLITLIAYVTTYWRTFLLWVYAPPLFIAIFYIFMMDESLRWLLVKGKKMEAQEIIRQAAKINNLRIDESNITCMEDDKTSNASLRYAFKLTVSSRKLLVRFFICICMWFTSLFNSYVLLINSVSLEGNKYIIFCLISLCDIISAIILIVAMTKFKRKTPLMTALLITGILCVSQPFVPKEHRWLSTFLYLCGKLNTVVSIRMTYLYTTELFPTYTRNTMLAMCSSLGRAGSIIAPLTPLLLKYWSGLPSFLVGILSLLTASIVTLMPNTSEDVLPDNVKQAEAIGCGQKEKEDCIS